MPKNSQVRKFQLRHKVMPDWCEKTDEGSSLRIALGKAIDTLVDVWASSEATTPFSLELSLSGIVPGDQFSAALAVQNARVALATAAEEIAEPVLTAVRASKPSAEAEPRKPAAKVAA